MLAVDPGEYRVILSMADSEGRVGSVSRAVTAFQMDGPGVSHGRPAGRRVTRAARSRCSSRRSSRRSSGAMAALMEAYVARQLARASKRRSRFCRAKTARRSPRCRCASAPGRRRKSPTMSAQFNAAALPPGRYLARGTLRQGGKPQGHMIRPFRIVADAAAATAGAPRRRSASMPNEMAMVLLGGVVELRSQGAADAGDADVDVCDGRGARRPDRRRR